MRFGHEDMIGRDTEQAYANVFHTERVGGVKDGGKDVLTNDPNFPFIQVKSSWPEARKFLAIGASRHQFIPVCIGEPGTQEEVLRSIEEYGGWVEKDMPMRKQVLEQIRQVRDHVQKQSRQPHWSN